MGKASVMIPFNPPILKRVLLEKHWNLVQVAEYFGISRQAVNGWFSSERIPPRKLADLAQKLEIEPEDVKKILDKQDSVKDYARENQRLEEENRRLKQAIEALLGEQP